LVALERYCATKDRRIAQSRPITISPPRQITAIQVATLSQKSVIAHAFAKQSTLSQDPAIDGKCLASDTIRYLIGGNHEIIFGGFARNLLSRSI
jgi:hypothetical protein